MSEKKVTIPFRILLIIIPLVLVAYTLLKSPPAPMPSPSPLPPETKPPAIKLAELALPPDWSQLDRFQKTITRKTFIDRLQKIYTKNNTWQNWIKIDHQNNLAEIGDYILHFSEVDHSPPGSIWNWKTRNSLTSSQELPLSGLHIVLDPGHIGGSFAEIEEREYQWDDTLIQEGTMTLETAKTLAPMLQDLGAKVTLVRTELKPVTTHTAKDFADPRLFYRTSEIRARAQLINHTYQPDLVICLHYNGSASEIPENKQHFHIILNGTYTNNELAHEDELFQMLQRLLSGTIIEEIPLATAIATTFNNNANLPPYRYSFASSTSQNIANHPNLWARNLLANRIYQCPVIFMEPYVMNSQPFITRYRKAPQEIYHEYALSVAQGIASYYAQ